MWKNTVSILGSNPLLWCCPTVPVGNGLKFQLSVGTGELRNVSASIWYWGESWDKGHCIPTLDSVSICDAFYDLHNNWYTSFLSSVRDVEAWPPRDPALEHQKPFQLPDTPWTYENGDFNPALRPSNARSRPIDERPSTRGYTSALPPYHPDFEHDTYPLQSHSAETDSDLEEEHQGLRVRRGSEGYEMRPINREEMLREYIQSEVERAERYQVYQPEDTEYTEDCGSDSRDEIDVDDDRPLGLRN